MSSHIDYEINKELGECYLFMGEYDKSESYYKKASAVAPEESDPYLGLATICVQRTELDQAAAYYTQAASLNPSDKSLAGLGLIAMEKGDHESAMDLFIKALGHNPVNMVAINGLVQEGHFLQRLDDVVPILKTALEAQETEAFRYTLAGCLTALGRDAEAKVELETLLGANPDNESAQELYARLAA
jgi:Flp pilus assembly protein TadD, contains TPR repeats